MTEIATRNIPLNWEVFVTSGIPTITSDLPPGTKQQMWSPISSTLIYGRRDAVLVDTFITVEQEEALVDWVAARGKNLTTIYATHGHGDHFFGASTVLQRLPRARLVATPDVVKIMRQQASPQALASFWNPRFPGQISDHLVIAEELTDNAIDLEGYDLVAVPLGHTEYRQHDLPVCSVSWLGRSGGRRLQRCPPVSRRVQSTNTPRVDCLSRHDRGA
jgi:glyoxylase-like metal-dependent hydrolase (beta-lactamase superfamily II)